MSLAKRRRELDVSDEDILVLRDTIGLMGGYWLALTYMKDRDGSEGNIYLTGNYWIRTSH